jgi:hypothetical protein
VHIFYQTYNKIFYLFLEIETISLISKERVMIRLDDDDDDEKERKKVSER